jgi:hypothetical protein
MLTLETAALAGLSTPRCWKSWQVHSSPRIGRGFQISYTYDYVNKLRRTRAELILNHVNPNVLGFGQGSVGSIRGLNLAAVRPTTVQVPNSTFRVATQVKA